MIYPSSVDFTVAISNRNEFMNFFHGIKELPYLVFSKVQGEKLAPTEQGMSKKWLARTVAVTEGVCSKNIFKISGF